MSELLTAKQQALATIEALPVGASWSDILSALELGSDIDQGRQDADAGKVMNSAALLKELGLSS